MNSFKTLRKDLITRIYITASTMKQAYKKRSSDQKQLALEHIRRYFELADERVAVAKTKDPFLHIGFAKRYITLARNISMKYKVKIPSALKRRICKHCHTFLIPGYNCRVRLRDKKVCYYCSECRNFTRIPYLKEVKTAHSKD